MISEVNRAIRGRSRLDLFVDNFRWKRNPLDQKFRDFLTLPNMDKNIVELRRELAEDLEQAGSNPLVKPPPGFIDETLRQNPRFVKGFANTLNVLGTLAAIGSVAKEISNPDYIHTYIYFLLRQVGLRQPKGWWGPARNLNK